MKNLRFVLMLVIVSCVYVPPKEFILYQAAFNEANTATSELLDVYNSIEKSATDIERRFNPEQAALIAPSADAPSTGLYRRGFAAIQEYNAILARYASGESVTVLMMIWER